MDKEKYLKPAVDSTDVEIGVYGAYDCGPNEHWSENLGRCEH